MKKLLALVLIITSLAIAQEGIYLNGKSYKFIFGVVWNPITNRLDLIDSRGNISSEINFGDYLALKSDLNALQRVVDSIKDNTWMLDQYAVQTGSFIPNEVLIAARSVNPNKPEGYDYYANTISRDELIMTTPAFLNLKAQVEMLTDTLHAHSLQIWGGGSGVGSLQPTYAFYYNPVNFGSAVQSDTTMLRYIKNTGTGILTVTGLTMHATNESEPYGNPFVISWDSCRAIASGDSQEVYVRFRPSLATADYLHEWTALVYHNGGTNQTAKTDSFYLTAVYTPNIVSPTEDDTANIYVSDSEGSDSNSGRTRLSPFKTITKALQVAAENEVIGIKAGETIKLTSTLMITKSNITLRKYGTGARPIVTMVDSVNGWRNGSNWTNISTNVWRIRFPNYSVSSIESIRRLWIDGTEYAYANGLSGDNRNDLSGYTTTYGVSSINRFYHDPNGFLYVYSASNPALAFSSLNYMGGYGSTTTNPYVIQIKDADNVILKNLDIRGGSYACIDFNGADNLLIDSCDIGYTNRAGIIGDHQFGIDKTSDSVTISNCNIDSKRQTKINWENFIVEYGIYTYNAVGYKIYNNTIKNWAFGWVAAGGYGNTYDNEFYSNTVTAPDIEYGKGIQVGAAGDPYYKSNIHIYKNDFNDLTCGIHANNGDCGNIYKLRIYFNKVRNIRFTESVHADSNNAGFGIWGLINDSLYIFNNTFYVTRSQAGIWNVNGAVAQNNLFVNFRYYYPSFKIALGLETGIKGFIKNNGFYSAELPYADWYVVHAGTPKTIPELNNTIGSLIGSGNLELLGSLSTHFNTSNFEVSGSLLNAGLSITNWIGSGFTDINGNTVDRTTPNIGAIDNNP